METETSGGRSSPRITLRRLFGHVRGADEEMEEEIRSIQTVGDLVEYVEKTQQ